MLDFEYQCDRCGVTKRTKDLESFICKCGGEIKLKSKLNLFDPLTPYVSENIGPKPVVIESRQHRQRLMKERHLEIMPYKRNEYEGYRGVDKSGHKLTQHEHEVAQKRGLVLP